MSRWGPVRAWVVVVLVGCGGRTPLLSVGAEGLGSAAGMGAAGEGASAGRGNGAGSGTRAGGGAGDGGGGADGSGTNGKPLRVPVSCAPVKDDAQFRDGRTAFVDHEGCEGSEPCFSSLRDAVEAAGHGDTITVLPGSYAGTEINQTASLGALRIVSRDGPEVTTIRRIEISGERHAPGEIWIEGFTFRDWGASSPLVTDGWAVVVSGGHAVDVRIEGNVFERHGGRGAIGVLSSTVDIHVGAVIARNRIFEQSGNEAGLSVDLPSGGEEDYCIRIENNLIVDNEVGIDFFYTVFDEPGEQFELVNNTVVGNWYGLMMAGPWGPHLLVNNVFWGNEHDLPHGVELSRLFARHNLFGGGQFDGLDGNFTADPVFAEDHRLGDGSPALDRGELSHAPRVDLEGTTRLDPPDLGAFERADASSTEARPGCGDGVASSAAFEGCDDGNLVDGDGCSAQCLLEPAASAGQISEAESTLCAVRVDGALSCWGHGTEDVPEGEFAQVAVSANHACALQADGTVICWGWTLGAFTPDGTFVQISADYQQTCGVRDDGGVSCWDHSELTLEKDGAFTRVDTNDRVCALDAQGSATCWDPGSEESIQIEGPLLQTLPVYGGGCALHADGVLRCDQTALISVREAPTAALARVATESTNAVALRLDGRVLMWGRSDFSDPAPDRRFVEVVADFEAGCGLTADHHVYCWGPNTAYPQE